MHGLGYRPQFHHQIFHENHKISWFELLADNYLWPQSNLYAHAQAIREKFPISLHSVGLNIAGVDPLCEERLKRLKHLCNTLQPEFFSDHLCWSAHAGHHHHDLLPFPLNEESLNNVSQRVLYIQESLDKRIYLENLTYYLEPNASEMHEAEFLSQLVMRTGCGVLLDLNNLQVNFSNLGIAIDPFFQLISPDDICYFHIAGYEIMEEIKIDSHGAPVQDDVWRLLAQATKHWGAKKTLVEWDQNLPDFSTLCQQVTKTAHIQSKMMSHEWSYE